MTRTVQIINYVGELAYEVDLSDDGGHAVYVIKARKPAGFGYSHKPGTSTYRSTIKVGSATWKQMVKRALSGKTDMRAEG